MNSPTEDLHLMPAARAREVCGGVSTTTLWRWENDETLNFPQSIEIRKRKFFRVKEIVEWLAARGNPIGADDCLATPQIAADSADKSVAQIGDDIAAQEDAAYAAALKE